MSFIFKVQRHHEEAIDVRVGELLFNPSRNVRHFKGYLVNGYEFRVNEHEKDSCTTHSVICIRRSVYVGEELDYYGTLLILSTYIMATIKLYYLCVNGMTTLEEYE